MKKKSGLAPDRKIFSETISRLEPYGGQILDRWSQLLRESLEEPGALLYRTFCAPNLLPALKEGDFPSCYRILAEAAEELSRADLKFSDLLAALYFFRESFYPFLFEELPPEQLLGATLSMDRFFQNALAAASVSFIDLAAQGEKNREADEKRALTKRETEVIQRVAEGYKNREIAEQLGIGVKTVETHRANIMNKLGFRNLSQLIRYAIQKGMINIESS